MIQKFWRRAKRSLKTLGQDLDSINTLPPLAFYWGCLCADLKNIHKLNQQYLLKKTPLKEDQILQFWRNCPQGEFFFKTLAKHSILVSSQKSEVQFKKLIDQFYERHFLQKPTSGAHPFFEAGEVLKKGKITSGDKILLHQGEHHSIWFFPGELRHTKITITRLQNAIEFIQAFSPELYEIWAMGTWAIVGHQNPKIVSYSFQTLPGFSVINLKHRDHVDLIDDLLHENGHHLLNLYLYQDELIDEQSDWQGYSPWRQTPRPVRGLYHAFYTFFWAYALFKKLSLGLLLNSLPNYKNGKISKMKCFQRFLEEFTLLELCAEELALAKRENLISPQGLSLIAPLRKELGSAQTKKLLSEIKTKHPSLKIFHQKLVQLHRQKKAQFF